MKLLLFTQTVDTRDPDLGFFHSWLIMLSKKVEMLTVVCLRAGQYQLPANVTVLSLGKEKGVSRGVYLWRFYRYCWQYRKNYSSVFVHMNPEYAILGGPLWRLWGKTIGLWYVHKAVNWRLRLGAIWVHHIFTASKESFRLKSSKIRMIGHGIPVGEIVPRTARTDKTIRLLSVSRLSPVKDVAVIVDACSMVHTRHPDWRVHLDIVGDPITPADQVYTHQLQKRVRDEQLADIVRFTGGVAYADLQKRYQEYDILVHASRTGSLDKVVLEALAAGLVVATSSDAAPHVSGQVWPVKPGDSKALAQCIEEIVENGILEETFSTGRVYVGREHALSTLIDRILGFLQ